MTRLRRTTTLFAILFTLLLPLTASPAAAETVNEEYDVPSSFVVRGIFGFGYLTCSDPLLSPVDDLASNGPCIDYSGHEGSTYSLSVDDDTYDATSVTITVDVDGDGCISSGCGDRDYRNNGCQALTGTLPTVDAGVTPEIWTYIRAIDMDMDTFDICGGSQGEITIVYG